MTRAWCEWAWLGGDALASGVVIDVEGDRIASVGRAERSPAGAERLVGVTLPGLVNAHSHAFHRALRGRTHDHGGSFWTWREQMYELAGRLDPDRYHRLARATFAEMALAGITAVGEFHYVHHQPGGRPYDDPNAMGEAVLAAAAEVGVRITLLDTCYLRGGIGDDLAAEQRRFSDGSTAAWADRVRALRPSATARIGAAAHSVRALAPDQLADVAAAADAGGLVLHAHVSEQPAEVQACLDAFGRTPVQVLAGAGALSARFTAVHAIHLTPGDADLLAGAIVCACPTTERDLADGIIDAARLQVAGVGLCLGSDSHAVIDLLEEARAIELDQRLDTGRRGGLGPAELLTAATSSGARSLGWPEAGRLEAGALADLVTIDAGSVRLAGAPAGSLAPIVFAAAAADVRHVVVGGRVVVRDGCHTSLDVPAELAGSIEDAWS